uniref:Glycoside hydrolase family 5 domain-containing protein n=1 Tax=Tetradesmus obliquus TaxID=3088 RepID=A0A383VWA1_TETOB|eukprot:jgi/Sobl393_1/14390/SZX69082.1
MPESPSLLDVRVHSETNTEASKRTGRISFGGAGRPPVLEYKKGWFWAVALPSVLIVAVIVPLIVTVVDLKEQVAAAHRASIRSVTLSAAAAAAGTQYVTAAECREVMPKEASPVGTPPPALRISKAKLVTADNGTEVTLHGVNWFGFNNGKTMVDGLDAGNGTWLAADFATIVYRMKLLGFNAVRLPFRFSDLEAPTTDYARPCVPENPLSAFEIAQGTLPGDVAKDFAARMPTSEFLLPMNSVAGTCNSYLPNGITTLPRFLWVVEYLVANGMYVLVDYHPHETEMAVLADPDSFARKWRGLWSAFTCLPNFASDLKGRVFLDLLNEPDELGMGWSGGKTREFRPLGSYLLAAMEAINAVSPGDAIFFIQGGGQVAAGTAWGDGFATDPELIRRLSLEDANPFFAELLGKPYRKQVVLSPHFYGQSITNSSMAEWQLWEALTRSWGQHMVDNGYCVPMGECQRFPVVVGEIGSNLTHPMDRKQLGDFATYMNRSSPTDNNHLRHEPVSGWFWFCWNANSQDTGGLVEDDWQTLVLPKLAWLVESLGLRPWWMQPTLGAPKQEQQQEEALPLPRYSSKRQPRNNPDTSAKAAALLGSGEPIQPPTHVELVS